MCTFVDIWNDRAIYYIPSNEWNILKGFRLCIANWSWLCSIYVDWIPLHLLYYCVIEFRFYKLDEKKCKIEVIPNGMDQHRFSIGRKFNYPKLDEVL